MRGTTVVLRLGLGLRVLGGDIDAAEFGAAVGRERPSTLVGEERAGALRRDDEPDEAARREQARRCCRHVRFEVLQGAHLGCDHAARRLRPVCVHPFVGQCRFVIQRYRCWQFLLFHFDFFRRARRSPRGVGYFCEGIVRGLTRWCRMKLLLSMRPA